MLFHQVTIQSFANNLMRDDISPAEAADVLRAGLDHPSLSPVIIGYIDPALRQNQPKPNYLKGIGPATLEALRPGILNLIELMKPTPKFEEVVDADSQYENWLIRSVPPNSIRVLIDLPNNLIRHSNTLFAPLQDSPLKTDLAVFPSSEVIDGFLYSTQGVEDYSQLFGYLRQGNCQDFSFAAIDYISSNNYQQRQDTLSSFSYGSLTHVSYSSPVIKSTSAINAIKAAGGKGYFLYNPSGGGYTPTKIKNPNFVSVVFNNT